MRESPAEASEDSQNDSKPQTQDTSQNSNSETDSKTFAEFDSTPRFRKGFRRKKGESPYVCDMNVKFKKEKKQSTFLNPDPWARLVGSRNTAAIYIDGIATTALYDTGAELQLISKEFCEQNKLKIQPIEPLIECKGVVGTGLLEYDGYVEVNVQIPGRDFSEDHLFLVSSMMNSQKDMPVIVGNFFIDSLNKYLKNLSQEEFETLDKTIQNVYFARIEASRIKEQYGCEPPLGFVKTTKAYTIPANSHIGIHGLTKVKHGGWSVNVVNENPQITPLPHGLKTENTLSQLSPGSNRILVAMSNYSDKDITIPAKTIISQLSLGNKIPKMIYPGNEKDSELLDKDEGLKYEHFEQHKLISEELKLEPEEYIPTSCDKTCDQSHTVEIEDLGPDLEEDIEFQNSYTENDKPNLGKSDQPTSSEEDDGSWILKLIDLSGLEKWSDEDKNVQKLLKEKEEKPKPQAHLHPNPPPPLDFTESGNIPSPGMNQESFLQCSQIMLQGLADKGFIHAKSPKFNLFFGMKDKNKIEFDMWERQVLAAATDHSDTAIRQAMLQSLKGQALMVTTTLPPNTHWKDLLQALRIKYQSKAPYDVLMSQFYSTKMDASEDCASFGIRLEQKLNQVTLQYPDKISTKIYWNHVRDRFFHGLSPIMKANLRTEFQSGSDYYKLLDIAREIEAEKMSADSVNETSKSTHGKGKPKVGAITVDSTTAQQISQLQGAVKGLTNWMVQ